MRIFSRQKLPPLLNSLVTEGKELVPREMAEKFDRSKEDRLSAADLSRKGSIDGAIVPLVEYINDSFNYFTTSSCSGRIIIVEQSVSA